MNWNNLLLPYLRDFDFYVTKVHDTDNWEKTYVEIMNL